MSRRVHLGHAAVLARPAYLPFIHLVDPGHRFLAQYGGEALVAHAAETRPWAVAVGRQGLDAEEGDSELGSTVEYLVRKCPSNVLVVAQPKPSVPATRAVSAAAEARSR